MMTETEPTRERLRPRIVETEETGRLDLRLPVAPEADLAPALPRRAPSPLAVAMTGLGILVVGVAGMNLRNSSAPSLMARVSACWRRLPAGAGGAGYWLIAELRGPPRLRSAERLRRPDPIRPGRRAARDRRRGVDPRARSPAARSGREYRSSSSRITPEETRSICSRFVLAPADRLAQAAIRRAQPRPVINTATVLLDTLLLLHGDPLNHEIAEIYGQRPGFAGTVHLRRLASGAGSSARSMSSAGWSCSKWVVRSSNA
jgi:hypothetical protein